LVIVQRHGRQVYREDVSDDFDAGLERLRIHLERVIREGWVPEGAGKPRTLTPQNYEAAVKANKGGWTGLDWALLRAVHEGAQPGDPFPPLEARPLILGVHDVEVRIVGAGPERRVAAFFSYEPFPGTRFGHRFKPDETLTHYEHVNLMEEIETGGLHRLMTSEPELDEDGVIWTSFWGR
jgi:hypothetical protein